MPSLTPKMTILSKLTKSFCKIKIKFSRSALFHVKARVCLKYFVLDCLFSASDLAQASLNLIFYNNFSNLRSLTQSNLLTQLYPTVVNKVPNRVFYKSVSNLDSTKYLCNLNMEFWKYIRLIMIAFWFVRKTYVKNNSLHVLWKLIQDKFKSIQHN